MENTERIVVMTMLCAFSVVGALGNSLVLYIYGKRKKDKTTSTIFILTLATTDFLTCVVLIPFNAVVVYLAYRTNDFSCKLYMFLLTCNMPFAAFIMVAIAFDRFFCICHPFLHIINVPRSKIIVFSMAIFSCLLGFIASLGHGVSSVDVSWRDINSTGNVTHNNPIYCLNQTHISGINVSMKQSSIKLCKTKANQSFNMACINDTHNQEKRTNMTPLILDVCSKTKIFSEGPPGDGCTLSSDILPRSFTLIYQKIYAGFYLICFIAVVILYGFIYRAIHVRRAQKSKRKRSSLFPCNNEPSMLDTQMTVLNGNDINARDKYSNARKQRRQSALKDKLFYANIRTAAMLFVVTLVFLIVFLPAWLMAIRLMSYNAIIYNMYFAYNVANPLIYAFMNKSFRDDLIAVLIQCK